MRLSSATVLRLTAMMIVLTVVTSVIMLQFDWHGPSASVERDEIDKLLDVSIVLSSFVFSVVMVLAFYAVYKYRAKPGDESDGEPIHGNTTLEAVWTIVPTIIVLGLAGWSWVVLDDIEEQDADAMPVEITAQQFAWRFDYPDYGKTSTELHVPVGTQIAARIEALDVLHSFWVPEWGIKRDAVPQGPGGDEVDDDFVVTPDVEGTYSVVCTELCGAGHGSMRAIAVVESQQEFDAWIKKQNDVPGEDVASPRSTGYAGGNGAGSVAD